MTNATQAPATTTQVYRVYIKATPEAIWDAITKPEWSERYGYGGRVEYEADFFLLRPADAARGNRKILFDVTNRGRKYVHWRLMDARLASPAAGNDPRTVEDAGNGLFLRRGYTIVWSGWDPDAPRSNS